VKRLHAEGVADAAVIGRALAEGEGRILVRSAGRRRMPAVVGAAAEQSTQKETDMSCCGHQQQEQGPASAPAGSETIEQNFRAFLDAASAPGALGARTKRAMAIALSVLARCGPCLKYHVGKARAEGFSPAEIDEAAWMAIAFGGSPTMMFYRESQSAGRP
jgi:AhpD family alkylhydroperoxidase